MNVCCLQHVPFEGPGAIEAWAGRRGHDFTTARLDCGEPLPDARDLDLLVVMGGPMSVHDEAAYPWLAAEKKLIAKCLVGGRFTLGVCLGSQLLAEALGARVIPSEFKEIGWFPVERCADNTPSHLFSRLPPRFTVFQWHGETYDLPAGTRLLATSVACPVQAFEHPYALGLQFHLEMTLDGVSNLVRECVSGIGSGPYEQPPDRILAATGHCSAAEKLLDEILNGIEARMEESARLVGST
jgi:GMP synthase-like glutamine amidotransferase